MKNILRIPLLVLLCSIIVFAQKVSPTIVLNSETLQTKRTLLANKKDASLELVTSRADKIVKAARIYSVMDKEQFPPSGDKHDYMSQAPYWWSDPAKKNGLPYIRRDGERNPELNKISDTKEMKPMIRV